MKLDASVGASGPHDFAVRELALSSKRRLRPPHLIPTFVTIAKRPFEWEETVRFIKLLLPNREANYFCKGVWTEQQVICPSGNRHRCSERENPRGRDTKTC